MSKQPINISFPIKAFFIVLPFLLMSGMCEDDPIEIEIADDFTNTFHIVNKANESNHNSTGEVDLNMLIDKYGGVIKSSNLESATLTLREYDPGSITFDVNLDIGGVAIIRNTYTVHNDQAVSLDIANSFNFIQHFDNGKYSYDLYITSDTPLNDDNFFVDVTSMVKITVESN